jgi:PAS domain S-box-containing protein/putative nucleotidyltransferase with HDIG domain
MILEKFLYLLPYLLSLGFSLGILLYTWRHRYVRGATIYMGYMMAQTLWSFGFIMELTGNSLTWKISWDALQWVAAVWIILTIAPFVIRYTGFHFKHPALIWGLLCIVPALFILLLVLDAKFHLIYQDPHLVVGPVFSELEYRFGIVVQSFAIYSFLIAILCIVILIRGMFKNHRFYNSQTAIIIVGFLIPLVGSILTIAGVRFTPERDTSPITYAIGNLFIALGLFRYRLFDVGPVAREIVFESISDFVLVINNQNRIVDVNTAAVHWFRMPNNQLIGRSLNDVASMWPEFAKRLQDTGNRKLKAEFLLKKDGGEEVYYQVEVSPVIDSRKRLIGRVFVGRDVSESKKLELLLRNMTRELEQRVRERTSALAEAYDTTLEGWARALELRDKETEGHSRSVTELTLRLAASMNVPNEDLIHIRRGALLHDIGKMGIPDDILRKPGPLTLEEQKIVEEHPVIANRLLTPIAFLDRALEIPYNHHERWNGSGYPNGLKGNQIPLSARIFSVVDVWDAMRSERPYHAAHPEKEVLAYLQEQSGKLFDPEVVAAFMKMQALE